MKTCYLQTGPQSGSVDFLKMYEKPAFFKKLLSLVLISFFCSVAAGQSQKMLDNEWRCKNFTVQIGCCGITISTEVTVCCGCIFYGRCGCVVSRSSIDQPYDGYMVVDQILNNNKITSKTLSVTASGSVFDKETDLTHTIVTGDYAIQSSEDGHRFIIVKVAVK